LWDRAALRWRGAEPLDTEPIDIFKELKDARKILILPNDRIGGLFIGAPVYKAIRQSYPSARIQLLVDEKKATIARQIPFIDGIVTAGLENPVWSPAFKDLGNELWKEGFDLAFCLGSDCSFRLAQLCRVSGARLRVGFKREGIDSYNIEIVLQSTGEYEREQCFKMLRLLGLEGSGEIRWTLAEDKAQKIRARYMDDNTGRSRVVGIDLSRGESRGLSNRQLDDIVGRVVERGARAMLFFSLAERKQVNYLKETYGNRAILFEQDDLASVAALIQGCRTLISCNTDLLHLAISLQVPVVGLFDEDPQRWVGTGNNRVKVVRAQDLRAMSITQVVHALEAALKEARQTA